MKTFKVRVYNYIERFHDEYTVIARTSAAAAYKALERIFIETDYDSEDFEVLGVEEVE
jgi:hypothetical protein